MMASDVMSVCEHPGATGYEWFPLMPALIAIGLYGCVAFRRIAQRELTLVDLGYRGYLVDGFRAAQYFCAWVVTVSAASIAKPCLFLIDGPPFFAGMLFWFGLLVALVSYASLGVRYAQERNAKISAALKHNCANYAPPHTSSGDLTVRPPRRSSDTDAK